MNRISRWVRAGATTIANGAATTATIDVSPMAGGSIKFPTGVTSPATWEAKDSAGVWAAVHDSSNAALSSAFTVDKWIPIPEGVMIHEEVRAVTAANVTGEKTVEIVLKG